jgi:hypothetical protein
VNKKGLPVWKLAYSFSVYIILPGRGQHLKKKKKKEKKGSYMGSCPQVPVVTIGYLET